MTKQSDKVKAQLIASQNIGFAVIKELATDRSLRRYLEKHNLLLLQTIESNINIINFVENPPKKNGFFKRLINRMRAINGKGIELVKTDEND